MRLLVGKKPTIAIPLTFRVPVEFKNYMLRACTSTIRISMSKPFSGPPSLSQQR